MNHASRKRMNARALLLSALLLPGALTAAESLAPPHAPLVEGLPVPVTAHPDPQSVLQSPDLQLAAHKRLVFDYWRTVIAGGRASDAAQYLALNYTEHNPLLPTGLRAFQQHLSRNSRPVPVSATVADLVTLVAEGPYVALVLVAHYPEPDKTGATYTSTHFELFRIADGRIAEHWDSTLFRAGEQVPDYGEDKAVPVQGNTGTAQYAQLRSSDAGLFANKRLAFDLWRNIPEGGREELAELYVDPMYIQHNPNAATGREGFRDYMARRPDSDVESYLETPLVAMVAEGDLVVQVLQTERVQNGVTYSVPWFDMFRVENGLVMEHWDTAAKGELPSATRQGPLGL